MSILLFGKGGQVGAELQHTLAALGKITAVGVDSKELCGDFTNPDGIAVTIDKIAPDIIVNAAGYTAVDQAESEPDLARTINAHGPALLAKKAKERSAWLVHYSTDYVYNGNGEKPWVETDAACPFNVYGQTKLEGDEAIIASGCQHLIFRTSWIYGLHGSNFIKTMLKLGKEKSELKVVDDQVGAPTGADLVAKVTAEALRDALQNPDVSGLYHLAAGGETSWHTYACFVLDLARKSGVPITVKPEAIKAVPSSAYPTPAKRPHNSRLNTAKLRDTFGMELPGWKAGVTHIMNQLLHTRAAA